MIWVPNQLVGAPAGTDVTIDCNTEAHPKYVQKPFYIIFFTFYCTYERVFPFQYHRPSYEVYVLCERNPAETAAQ